MRKPENNGLFDWLTVATEDLADSFARLNHDLDRREVTPNWERKVWHDTLDTVSLRRWAFILPGGGALRGRMSKRQINPATPGGSPRRGIYQNAGAREVYEEVVEE